jgi:AcrR family transcriptional regulator
MARTTTITLPQILDYSLEIIDELGANELNTSTLAKKFKIKPPSLYNHIKSMDELQSQILLKIDSDLVNFMILNNSISKNKILNLALLYRKYAQKYPERYKYRSIISAKVYESLPDSSILFRDYISDMLIQHYLITKQEAYYIARTLRSFLHGFISFELAGDWSNVIDLDISYTKGIGIILKNLKPKKNRKN